MNARSVSRLILGLTLAMSCLGCVSPVGDRDRPLTLDVQGEAWTDLLVAGCQELTGLRPWLVVGNIGFLPPVRQTAQLRRGKAFVGELVAAGRRRMAGQLHDYAQVTTSANPFGSVLTNPAWHERPFLVVGELTDEDLVALWDLLREHMLLPSPEQERRLHEARETLRKVGESSVSTNGPGAVIAGEAIVRAAQDISRIKRELSIFPPDGLLLDEEIVFSVTLGDGTDGTGAVSRREVREVTVMTRKGSCGHMCDVVQSNGVWTITRVKEFLE